VFLKLWSKAVRQVIRGGPQAVSEAKVLQNLYQTLNELKIRPHMFVLKLALLVDLQQKLGELVLSTSSCSSIII
jgi:hypothetical protein